MEGYQSAAEQGAAAMADEAMAADSTGAAAASTAANRSARVAQTPLGMQADDILIDNDEDDPLLGLNPREPVAGVTLRGVVCGHSGAWHRVTFAKDHPEIEREVSLKAAALVPPAPAAAPAEHRRVGPTTVDLEEVQAANQQLLDAFADADAEPAGDSAEPDEYPAAPTPRPTPTELPPPDWEPASCYRCQREQARAYPPRSGHYRRNHSEASQAGVAWHFWQWFPSARCRAPSMP
eukprot:jgi/Tetstr1/429199/TSEL_019152.t1